MIELTVKEILESTDALNELIKQPLNGRTSFAVARMAKQIEKEYNLVQTTRKEIIERYCRKDENGQVIVDEKGNSAIPPEDIEDFNKEINDLLETKITLTADKINIDELMNVTIAPEKMIYLMAFISE